MTNSVPRYIYTLVYYCLIPFILLRLLWRGIKSPGYFKRWGERFGFLPASFAALSEQPVIWLHSVSVGETLAAVPLVKALQQQYPEYQFLVTTMTPTGSERVKASYGDSVWHVYLPYDLPGALKRLLSKVKPSLLIVMETELWPNLIHYCDAHNVPVILANARLSERSAKGYARVSGLTRPMLEKLTKIAVQTEVEAQRFNGLGARDNSLAVTGNMKFDIQLDDAIQQQANTLKQTLKGEQNRPVLLAASTHQGEDEIILDAYQQLVQQFTDLLLVIVPRHPERFADVGKLIAERGLSLVKRSDGQLPNHLQQVMLGDTMGELLLFYGACDVAFVGGSLVPVGGHNMIEPAAWGVPVLSGPHQFNFSEVSRLLIEAGVLTICHDSASMANAVAPLLVNTEQRQQMGRSGLTVVEQNQGALGKLLAAIQQTLAAH